MNYRAFGRELIRTKDLDPVYVMLAKARLSEKLLKRWLLAYWLFYHAGVASRIAESRRFYPACRKAFEFKWPRGVERRHFRTQRAWEAVQWLMSKEPECHVDAWVVGARSFSEVVERMRGVPEFGPWIRFKIADMAERVLRIPVAFSLDEVAVYKSPAQGAALISAGDEDAKVDVVHVFRRLIREFGSYKAPPWQDRACGVQEVETIACKYLSHVHGHYQVGKDTREVFEALHGWGDLAEKLQQVLVRFVGR